VDIYIGGGTHVGWPTYKFSDYVSSGGLLDTPTPVPPPSATPPSSSGALTASFSGDLNFSTGQLTGKCTADGFRYFLNAKPANSSTPTVRLITFSWPLSSGKTMDMSIQIYPEPQAQINAVGGVFEYSGQLTSNPVGSDPWNRALQGTLARSAYAGHLTVSGVVNCG
jgi:hypothetical protein